MSDDAAGDPATIVVSRADVVVSADIEVAPAASPDELAAILTAYETLWSDPSPDSTMPRPSDWRFAGRWWMGIGPSATMPGRRGPY